jgi:predicted transcriptional regulator
MHEPKTPQLERSSTLIQAWHLKQQGWPQRQIAEALGVSAGAVSQWMTRARQGGDLRFVQDWIGHASIKNTVIYAQLTSRRRDEEARKVFASSYVV